MLIGLVVLIVSLFGWSGANKAAKDGHPFKVTRGTITDADRPAWVVKQGK